MALPDLHICPGVRIHLPHPALSMVVSPRASLDPLRRMSGRQASWVQSPWTPVYVLHLPLQRASPLPDQIPAL